MASAAVAPLLPPPAEPTSAPLRRRTAALPLAKGQGGLFEFGFRSNDPSAALVVDVEADAVPAPSVSSMGPDRAPLNAAVAAVVPSKVLGLAREILGSGKYVGHSAFVLFGLFYKVRPMMWEGGNLKDILDLYVPWALETCSNSCAVEGVACVLRPGVAWTALEDLLPVGDQTDAWGNPVNGLVNVNHWVSAVFTGGGADAAEAADPLNKFYQVLGRFVLGTVCDGDCGIDVMAQMLELPQTLETRTRIRADLYEFIMSRHNQPWLHDMLVLTQELTAEQVQKFRESEGDHDDSWLEDPGGGGSGGGGAGDAGGPAQTAVAVTPPPALKNVPGILEALKWSCGVEDLGVLMSIADKLPVLVQGEQVAAHQESQLAPKAPKRAAPEKRRINPHMLRDRDIVCQAHNKHVGDSGWDGLRKFSYASRRTFLAQFAWPRAWKHAKQSKALSNWWTYWKKRRDGVGDGVDEQCKDPKRRRSGGCGGARKKCPWLSSALYEWWSHMRYNVDWQKVNAGVPKEKGHRNIARYTQDPSYVRPPPIPPPSPTLFPLCPATPILLLPPPQALLVTKAKDLVTSYCSQALLRGIRPVVPFLTPRWFKEWRKEYGLSLRKPNRKYKVPKKLLASRFETMILNVARVRAAAEELLGYDPHILNWDQSPFHHNESGTTCTKTLAVKGSIVPLIEGHDDSKARWTANLCVSSDTQDLRENGPPPAEFMFRGGDNIKANLEAHVLSKGYASWVSTATSEKGSYRLADVVEFLKTHLREPKSSSPQWRWRILMADDHSPHKADAVRRLAWQRGWVMIVHGGGTTPVAQPVDTDLNQHVKRFYMALETRALLQKMQDGHRVPQLSRQECIDIMVEVLSERQLHLDAAKGFIKTGIRVPLDGSQDIEICREAFHLWSEGGLREKVNSAVADVREECRREKDGLKWSYDDVFRLVHPYEERRAVDLVLEALGEETMGEDGQGDEEEGLDRVVQFADDSDLDSHASEMEGWGEAVEEMGGESDGEGARQPAGAAVAADGGCLEDVFVDAETAEKVVAAASTVQALEEAEETLRAAGCLKEAQDCRHRRGLTQKRMRELAREDDGLLLALTAQRSHEEAQQAKRRRLVEEANAMTTTLRSIKKQIVIAEKKKKVAMDKVQGVEAAVAAKHLVNQFSLVDLKKKCNRVAALLHLKRLKGAVSAQQLKEWDWFKDTWDADMKKQHGKTYPELFAGWLQNVSNEMAQGDGAAFSRFMHNESRRLLEIPEHGSEPLALVLPVEAAVAAPGGGAS